MTFRPYFGGDSDPRAGADDIVFGGGTPLALTAPAGSAGLVLGPTVLNDAFGLLVPAAGVARVSDVGRSDLRCHPER